MKTIRNQLLTTFIIVTFLSFSQSDTLNRLNSKGKKTGYWLKYLDDNVQIVDSINSFFYGYEYYDNGTKLFAFEKLWFKKIQAAKYGEILPKKGHPVLLTGTFRWFVRGDSAQFVEETYKDGYPLVLKSLSRNLTDQSIYISELFDYTKTYNNISGSFYVQMGRKKWYYMKSKKGWRRFRIKE